MRYLNGISYCAALFRSIKTKSIVHTFLSSRTRSIPLLTGRTTSLFRLPIDVDRRLEHASCIFHRNVKRPFRGRTHEADALVHFQLLCCCRVSRRGQVWVDVLHQCTIERATAFSSRIEGYHRYSDIHSIKNPVSIGLCPENVPCRLDSFEGFSVDTPSDRIGRQQTNATPRVSFQICPGFLEPVTYKIGECRN